MPSLTNFVDQCDLLNLAFESNGRGPYALRQDGSPPDRMPPKQERYLLRKDGTWVLNLTAFSLPEEEIKKQFLYRDIPELFAVIHECGSKPVVAEGKLPADKTEAEVLAALQSTASKLIARIRDSKGSKLEA